MSINWYDNDGALKELRERRKKNRPDDFFCVAAAQIPLNKLKMLEDTFLPNELFHERKKLDDNPYHGNLITTIVAPRESKTPEEKRMRPSKEMLEDALMMSSFIIEKFSGSRDGPH